MDPYKARYELDADARALKERIVGDLVELAERDYRWQRFTRGAFQPAAQRETVDLIDRLLMQIGDEVKVGMLSTGVIGDL